MSAWNEIFEHFGIKTVTATDKRKGAYVPTKEQLNAIKTAGIQPSDARPANEFTIKILFDERQTIGASFYHSLRTTDPTRRPEPRMGHEFISSEWLQVGDKLLIGNIGNELFAVKIRENQPSEEITNAVLARANPETIVERAKKSGGRPAKRIVLRNDFVRDPYVVAAALIRSNGKCEMPDCSRDLFKKLDGNMYLEVHHVVPLGEEGEDALANVAALCPHCHRELHFGALRMKKRAALTKHVAQLSRK